MTGFKKRLLAGACCLWMIGAKSVLDTALGDPAPPELSVPDDGQEREASDAAGCDCNDNNPCTTDTCLGCFAGSCLGGCLIAPVPAGTPCNDGIFCNGVDTCSGIACSHAGNPCLGGAACNNCCIESADSCICTGTACNDGLFCNGADTCSSGTCIHAGNPCPAGQCCQETTNACGGDLICNDAHQCTVDLCSAGVCTHSNSAVGTPCGNSQDTNCDNPDTCDGAGSCEVNFDPICQPILVIAQTTNADAAAAGLVTYRLYVQFPDPADTLLSAGFANISTDAKSGFYQHQFGGDVAPSPVLCSFLPLVCSTDSFVTIGTNQGNTTTLDGDFNSCAFNCQPQPPCKSSGQPAECGEVVGWWYNSVPFNGNGAPDENLQVLVAQFTFEAGFEVAGTLRAFYNHGTAAGPDWGPLSFSTADADGDGVSDPMDADDDNDAVLDLGDNCPNVANAPVPCGLPSCCGLAMGQPWQVDSDCDGMGDACGGFAGSAVGENGAMAIVSASQPREHHASHHLVDVDVRGIRSAGSDADGDGVPEAGDNCLTVPNPDQTDSDLDGVGDCCTAAFPDADQDGVTDQCDNCPAVPNGPAQAGLEGVGNQTDADMDGLGDACDCPGELNGDGLVNAQDLAMLLGAWGANPGHPADFNNDGVVNAADLAVLLGAWGPC